MVQFTPPRLSRRDLIRGVAAGAGLASLSAVPRAWSADPATVRIATYGGSWRDALANTVGKELHADNVKLDYLLDSPTGWLARLIAARGREPPFDCMDGNLEIKEPAISGGFVQKLDYGKLPNAAALPALTRSDFGVMSSGTNDGVVYNAQKFSELGISPPSHYSELANPKLAGRVAFPDITHPGHFTAAIGLAYDAGGDETTLEKAIPLINKINPATFYATSVDLSTKFGSGEIWAAPWQAGWAIRLKRTGLPIASANQHIGPKFGGMTPNLLMATTGTKNLANVHLLINIYLSAPVQYAFTKAVGIVPMNPEARARFKGDPEMVNMLLTDEELSNMLIVDFSKIDRVRYQEAWNRDLNR